MTILVTGANGMIGSQLVKELLAKGYDVVGIDRTNDESYRENYNYYQVDLADKQGIQKIADNNHVDKVIHLAALAHTESKPVMSWNHYYHINVECAKNVFVVAGERPVLYISTIDVYGFYDGKAPVTRNTPIRPISNYGKSKAMAEDECKKLSRYSIFRLSPVYSDENKSDIQKRYYLKYPYIAYQIGKGSEYEILNVKKAIKVMVDWCKREPQNDVVIVKDEQPMWTPDFIKTEKKAGKAKIVIKIPRWIINCVYIFLKKVLGENEKTYLLNKAVHPLKSK